MIDGELQSFDLTVDKFLTHAAKWHPRGLVVTARPDGGSDRITYADLLIRARGLSAGLAGLGVRPGHRVATLCWNTQAHVEAWYAIMAMGAVCHTLNPRLLATQSADMVAASQARIIFCSSDLTGLALEIAAHAPALETIIVVDGPAGLPDEGSAALLAVDDLPGNGEVLWGEFDENTPCGLCFTSGTTGAPKGVTYTHRGNFLHTLRLLQADVIGPTSRDSVLTAVPMFHANAWGLPFCVPAVGARLVLPGRLADGASLASLMAAEEVTIGVGVPTVWLGLMDHLDSAGSELPSLRRLMVGGSPMPPALMERIERRGIEVQTTWGMTELSPLGTATPPGSPDRRASASGRPSVGVDLALFDREDLPLRHGNGAEGRLHVRGAAVVERYFNHQEPATRHGWFDTGDLARIEEDGRLVITGRSKDLIKSGGEWINPSEIEAVVSRLPEVALAAVIGRPDPKWGERPVLFVETRFGTSLSDEALLEELKGQVASWWIPDQVVRLAQMPLASTGKIDKMRLREEYGQG